MGAPAAATASQIARADHCIRPVLFGQTDIGQADRLLYIRRRTARRGILPDSFNTPGESGGARVWYIILREERQAVRLASVQVLVRLGKLSLLREAAQNTSTKPGAGSFHAVHKSLPAFKASNDCRCELQETSILSHESQVAVASCRGGIRTTTCSSSGPCSGMAMIDGTS